MAYLDTTARTTSPTNSDKFQPAGRTSTLYGVFVGFVKELTDIQKNGRLRVWIPEFGSAPDNPDGWIIVNYCSPFAGATNVESISKSDIESFEGTQTSYGFWMVPPDINNQVLVMFINGDASRGIWIGSLYNQFMNNMIPGMAADSKNWQHPGKVIPVAEYNKWDEKVTLPDRAFHPYEKTKFKGVGNQGLINDQGRGVTSSSARRESPSQVFGIITPGPPVNPDVTPDKIRRKGGSSFIMDDGTGSEYVELATKTGAKIRLDETNGFVYIINRDGTAWMQMDQQGHIDVFSQFDISIRAQRDINMRADRDINIESGQNTYISAAKDTITNSSLDITYDINNVPKKFDVPWYQKCARGLGYGGNIVFSAEWDIHSTVVQHNYYNTTLGTLKGCGSNSPSSCQAGTPDGSQHYWSRNNFHWTTLKNFHFWAHCVPPDPKACMAPTVSGNLFMKLEGNYNLRVVKAVPICGKGDIKIKIDGTYNLASDYDQYRAILKGGDFHFGGADPPRKAILQAGPVYFNNTLDVVKTTKTAELSSPLINITVANIGVTRTVVIKGSGVGEPGKLEPPGSPVAPVLPADAQQAEQKGLSTATNILPPIKEPFFTRGSQGWPTIVSRWPTYEPCPLHEQFKFSTTSGYSPELTEGDKTYSGSSSGPATTTPKPNTDTGANNQTLPPPDPGIVSKDFNMKAFQCQLKAHEGQRNEVYKDTKGLDTAGIGHLLRENEKAQYPLGSKVSEDQVNTWFAQDSTTSIKDAQNFLGMETWEKLDDNRKRAVADMAYNMGGGKLSQFKSFKKEMQAGNYDQAAKQIEGTPYYQQVKSRGPKIANQIRNGVDPNGCDKKFPPDGSPAK